ncbi:MAG: hypothetical protein JSW53_06575 [Candidatus Bathyarchaeota archaeon]|nr:MAG: hypothetical protein JSW53_06575 [Candidatus Bathyarchaeota archaeon]
MKLSIQSEKTLALVLIIIGTALILFSLFQAFLGERELSLFGETLTEKGFTNFESLGHNLMWLLTVLIEFVGGFFLASIGLKTIKQ